MNSSATENLILALTGRRGAVRLLRALGFATVPRPVTLREQLALDVHTALATPPDITRAYLIELRHSFDLDVLRQVARAARMHDPVAFALVLVAEPRYARVALLCETADHVVRHIVLARGAVRASDLDVVAEMLPRSGESGSALALRFGRALDRQRVTQRFFRDVVGMRDMISQAWIGPHRSDRQQRDALALLLLSRLLFLYFLQRRGALAGDPEFLPNLLRRARVRRTSFFRSTLRTLFFGVLNRRPERRTSAARLLGDLPYLNGGLFEEHRLELRHEQLDLPDVVLHYVFSGLLEKYRFTAVEGEPQIDGNGIDPEMLGRIFENLMPGDERDRTGTFYTPPAIVRHVVAEVLFEHLSAHAAVPVDAVRAVLAGKAVGVTYRATLARELARIRVLDPACGSGAFLMGSLQYLERLRTALGESATSARSDIVARTLHGVDLLEDAALICSLRLWLALIPGRSAEIAPLPNLDRRVRQGDALVDPLDLRAGATGCALDITYHPTLGRLLAQLEPLAAKYVSAAPEDKRRLRRELATVERQFAVLWSRVLLDRLVRLERELTTRAADRDLFSQPVAHAITAARQLPTVTDARAELQRVAGEVAHSRTLPFFSFRVHFAEATAGFDIIVSNPPWVRAHRWPAMVRRVLRARYRVCREAGWPAAARLSGTPAGAAAQVDLSLLFLERAIELLAARGTLGMLLPAKLFRSLYAGGARALVSDCLHTLIIEDHSLDHRAIFAADAFTCVLIARRREEHGIAPAVRVTMTRTGVAPLKFSAQPHEMSLHPGDVRAPWLLAPPMCVAAFRQMQNAPMVGDDPQLSVHRGAMTGCNDVMVLRHVEPKLDEVARIQAEGSAQRQTRETTRGFGGYIESSVIRPTLRGTDVSAFRIDTRRHVIWVPANDDSRAATPPRVRRFLLRHRAALGGPTGNRLGMLHRVGERTLGHKVVWSDVARNLRAAAVPQEVRNVLGRVSPIVPLNTVYFLATASYSESLILSAYLNSTPVRTFARAIAERAKDAHFRFFAWTVAALPLPRDWRDNDQSAALLRIAQQAHERGASSTDDQKELDDVVAQAYGLTQQQLAAIRALDCWFDGTEGYDCESLTG